MTDFVEDLIKQELLKEHGLDESIDNKNSQAEDCKDFFYLCSSKIQQVKDTDEYVEHDRFIQLVDKLNCKFPFMKINEFIEDYVKGTWNSEINEKYNFSKKSDYESCITRTMLNLPQKREKKSSHNDKSDYAKRINLKQTRINEEYNFIIKESEFFKEELEKIYNFNLAMSVVILKNLNGKISKDEMMESEIVCDEDEVEIFKIEVDEKISEIINEEFKEIEIKLYKKNIFLFSDDKYKLKHNFNSIETNIKEIVYESGKEGITFYKLMNELNKKIDFIFSIPSYRLINNILNKFVEIEIFKVESGFRNSDELSRRFFTKVNYYEQNPIANSNNTKFYGRPNDAIQFIHDIRFLIKGDFGDEDDQVTRIAGLILAGTQKMVAEPETLMEFDFAVSMDGFVPTEEQIKQMKENDLQIYPDTKIIHIKVAINDEIDSKLITKLKMILPDNEQGMIITYAKMDKKTNEILKKDKDIQIIDKKLLHLWAETIPTLPSRKGSNVKIMEGKHLGGIGRLINIDYITGKATLDLISYESNIVEYIKSIEEINLFDDPIQDNFIILHDNYNEFLKTVRNNSNSIEFNKAIINAQTVDEKFFPPNDNWSINKITPFIVESKNTRTTISIKENKFNKIFSCTCEFFKENNKLCYHLISILNELGIRYDSFNETWGEKSNMVYNIISKISK